MMVRFIVWVLPMAAACSFGQAPVTRPPLHRIAPRVAVPVSEPMLSTTAAAPAPTTMYQMPSKPPQVTYQNGMLSIVAENSTLGDILREVHRSTGAAIDVPSNATERVVARIGPGPARDVMASLLNGSSFNYVMLGSTTDPTSLASVMLTMKSGGGGAGAPVENAANVYQPPAQPMVMAPGMGPGGPVAQAPAAGDDQADAEDDKDDDSADDDQAQDQAQGGATPAADGSGTQPNANGGPKTPEQILEMLRQRPGQQPNPQIPQPPQQQPPPNENN